MTFDPYTATTTELRDWLLRMDGLESLGKTISDMPWAEEHWDAKHCRWEDEHECHPHPPTLDGAAAALPKGWDWEKRFGYPALGAASIKWSAFRWEPTYLDVEVAATRDPIHDLYLLAVLARRAQKENAQ